MSLVKHRAYFILIIKLGIITHASLYLMISSLTHRASSYRSIFNRAYKLQKDARCTF